MTLVRPILILVFLIGMADAAIAQSTIYKGKKLQPRNYNRLKISRAKAGVVCPVFDEGGYPYKGIGFKLGDPFAVTFKYYLNKHIGFVADFGRSASSLYSTYYTRLFDEEFVPDPGDTLLYYSHKVKSDWVGELKLLYHIDAEKLSPGLRIYVGAGWEMRDLAISYQYITEAPATPETITTQEKRSTFGAQAVFGIEYANFKLPVSAFMELEYYFDLGKDPGFKKLQGGVGLRYIF